jgi:2-haloacid dehalogenase
MYSALAPLVGVVITLMNGINSRFSGYIGGLFATLVIHLVGLVAVSAVLLAKPEKREPGGLPLYYYLGGFVGVGTVFSCMYAFSALGASLAVALALLGQTLFSLAADSTGFMGRRKYPLSLRRLPGLALAFIGAAIMAGDWKADALALLVALASGLLPGLTFVLNSELGRKKGVFRSVRVNYIVGLATILALIAFLRPPAGPAFAALREAGPLLALGGGLLGVAVVGAINFIFPRIPALSATLLMFVGQAFAGLLIDLIAEGALDAKKLAGTLILLAGLAINSILARPAASSSGSRIARPKKSGHIGGSSGKYDLVFLDADDTLFDFGRAEKFALERSFSQFGLRPSESAFLDYDEINKGLWRQLERGETVQEKLKKDRFRLLFQRLGEDIDAEAFSAAYISWLSKGSFLLEGAEELCEYLSPKYTLAIITNGIKDVQLPRIGASAIARHISSIIVSEEAGSSKPNAGIFEYACATTGFHRKDRMMIVGDSLSSDIRGGIDFGIDTCWANFSRAKNESGLKPSYEIATLAELRGIL